MISANRVDIDEEGNEISRNTHLKNAPEKLAADKAASDQYVDKVNADFILQQAKNVNAAYAAKQGEAMARQAEAQAKASEYSFYKSTVPEAMKNANDRTKKK